MAMIQWIIVVLQCCLFFLISVQYEIKAKENELVRGYVTGEDAVSTSTVSSLIQCIQYCSTYAPCKSVLFKEDVYTCRMYSKWYSVLPQPATEDHWRYYHVYKGCNVKVGYKYHHALGICYKYHSGGKHNFIGANSTCYDEGAYLFKVDSKQKHEAVVMLMNAISAPATRIQGNRKSSAVMEYIFDDGQPLNYFDWGRSQPTGYSSETGLAILQTFSYRMADVYDSDLRPFICEIPM